MATKLISSARGQEFSRGAEGEPYISIFTAVQKDLKPERFP